MDAGLTFAGDPEWFYDLDRDRQRATLGYLYARMERGPAAASVGAMRLSDVLGLLKLLGLVKDKGKAGGDIESMLGSVFGDEPQDP